MPAPPSTAPAVITTDAYVVETVWSQVAADADVDHALRLLDAQGLRKFLKDDIEHTHYNGDQPDAIRIWRYDSGHFCELIVVHAGSRTDDSDWIHGSYALHEKADAEAFGAVDENKVLEFTVRIDGRV